MSFGQRTLISRVAAIAEEFISCWTLRWRLLRTRIGEPMLTVPCFVSSLAHRDPEKTGSAVEMAIDLYRRFPLAPATAPRSARLRPIFIH
jgi:hypothetical protein